MLFGGLEHSPIKNCYEKNMGDMTWDKKVIEKKSTKLSSLYIIPSSVYLPAIILILVKLLESQVYGSQYNYIINLNYLQGYNR